MKTNIITRVFAALALSISLSFLPSCSTISARPAVAQLAVQYGVVKFLERNPSYAPRVVEIADMVAANAGDTKAVTVAILEQVVRANIHWDKLDAADTVLVNGLIAAVRDELVARLGDKELTPEQALVVKQVASWIRDAANLSTPQ